MSNFHNAPDFGPDFEPDAEFTIQGATTLTLDPEAMAWAVQVSQPISDETEQWQSFLRAIALRGFQQWLEMGALDLAACYDPNTAPPVGINCRVGGFRLCLLPQGSLSDDVITIPQTTLDDARHCAHLYVLVDVQEEADQVTILSSLRHDQLRAYQHQGHLNANPDGTYTLPMQLFDTPPERLLLYLSCLNPAMLAEPQTVATPAAAAPSPNLIDLGLGQVINAGRWLQNQLDEVADRLAWTLMTPMTPAYATAMRSPTEELDSVLAELPNTVTIPTTARGAFTDLQRLGLPFRLYALTWTLFESETPEWSLFLMLGPIPGEQLPTGTRLVVHDADTLLASEVVSSSADSTHLYAQVIGNWDEQFTTSIYLPNGAGVNLPPFGFRPE